jgi:hypothetical protein
MRRDLPRPADLLGRAEPDNLEVASRLARETLSGLDPGAVAERSGAIPSDVGLALAYLGAELGVRLPGWTVHLADGSLLNPYEQVLVLHYLSATGPVPPVREPITFAEVPSGEFYSPAFDRRARIPLLRAFGEDPERVVACAAPLGGRRVDVGDVAVSIPAFPRVEIVPCFHRGDEEFPPDVTLLLSSSIASYLSTEDIAHLAGLTASRIIKESRK